MATPIENLSSIDFKVLGYINKSKYVTKERIFKKFKKVDALEYRLELLCEKDYEDKGFIRDAVENSSYVEYVKTREIYYITPLGKKDLQDNKHKVTQGKRLLIITHWLPISVSILSLLVSVMAFLRTIF